MNVTSQDGEEADGTAVDTASLETEISTDLLKAEFLIPTFIGELLDEKKMTVKVLRTNDTWYGMDV